MYFTEERIKRIIDELVKYIYPVSEKISTYKFKKGNFKGGELKGLDTSDWETFSPGDRWGGRDQHFWFRTNITIPSSFHGKTVVYEVRTGREGEWDALNPQFIAYVDGRLVQGLDVNHREIIISEQAKEGESYTIALHAYGGMKEGLVELNTSISVFDRNVEKLYYDIKVPYEVAILLDKEDKRRIDIINFLNQAINMLDLRKPLSSQFYQSIRDADAFLESEFYGKYCGHSDVTIHSIGHTHIDVAWLWTIAQTREKAARSFSTALSLMKDYPEYIFMASQPQLYEYIKEDHPDMYRQIKEKVKEGQWEAEGGMWLEADCNIASGESLVRQVLFGKRFFNEEFNVESKMLWLPDVFGYSAALPQILKKSGIDYFMTTKISWNEYNKMPYDTFMWEGIDGTEIFTHFSTAAYYENVKKNHRTIYEPVLNPSSIKGSWARYQQKALTDEIFICYGYGDGGGGPTKEMLENARRMEKGIPGCPKVRLSKALDAFEVLEKKVINNSKFNKWVGELYLEYHRGTYTSMARNKKFNRKSELLFQDAELLSVISTYAAGSYPYPQDKINSGWKAILLNQFHDILPGTSIKEVYEDSTRDYKEVLRYGKELVSKAIDNIACKINADNTASVIVFNQLSSTRTDIVEFELPEGFSNIEIMDYSGKLMTSQIVTENWRISKSKTSDSSKDYNNKDNKNMICKKVIFLAEDVPAKGYKTFKLKEASSSTTASARCDLEISANSLKNAFFDIKLDNAANIISIYDKVNDRQVLKSGEKANVLQAFEDKPHLWDAWDINIYYQEKMWEINDVESVEVLEQGPVRASIRVKKKFLDSTITQDVRIYNGIPRIDFVSGIDWKEKQIFLKTAFPIDIHADKATYEIQYGNVERPTHWNTSWDYARFEVCAHKWADLSEDGYGVSLLNDSKYGYDIKDGVMRLSLLKSATYPNEDADREYHEFTYSLYPHAGNWKTASTVQMAYSLNCPMYAKVSLTDLSAEDALKASAIKNSTAGNLTSGDLPSSLPAEFSFVKSSRENVIIEVVKKAEDSDNIIVRVYECYNRRTKASLEFFTNIQEAWECDLMENNLYNMQVNGNSFEYEIKPYEIKTFKVRFA